MTRCVNIMLSRGFVLFRLVMMSPHEETVWIADDGYPT